MEKRKKEKVCAAESLGIEGSVVGDEALRKAEPDIISFSRPH